jgi:hypothetical protein
MARYSTDGSSALAPNDPYNNMERSDVPHRSFEVIEGGGGGDGVPRGKLRVLEGDGGSSGDRRAAASDSLSDAERSASTSPSSVAGGGADEAKSVEASQSFINSVTGDRSSGGDKKKKKGIFLKRGPLLFILTVTIGGGGLMLGTQSLMPFSLIAQFQETFDSIKTVSELRTNSFMRYQMAPDARFVKDPIRATMFGRTKFRIGSNQAARLARQGITVQNDFEYQTSSGATRKRIVLRFDDGSGFDPIIIAPTDAIAAEIDANNLTAGVISHDAAMREIPDYRNGYIRGSRTWRGSVKAWFDTTVVRFLEGNRLTRNRFKGFRARVNAENAGNTRSVAIEMMKLGTSESIEGTARNTVGDAGGDIDDGSGGTNTVPPSANTDGSTTRLWRGATMVEIQETLRNKGDAMHRGAASSIQAVVSVTCTVFNFIGMVNLMLVAWQGMQIIQLVTGFFEAIQKVQAGDGADSPLPDLANGLTTPVDTVDHEGGVVRANMTAMGSSSITALYGNMPVDQNDHSVASFNLSSQLNSLLGFLGVSIASFLTCAAAKAAAALAGAVMDVVIIVGCIMSFGIGCVVGALKNQGISIAVSVGLGVAIGEAVKHIAPVVFRAFARDIISDLAGEDLGNAIMSGANMYMGGNHKSGGGSPTNAGHFETFLAAHQQVIANEAEYQRSIRSPFDISSKYTFMGSIAHQMVAFTAQASSFTGVLTGMGNVVRNSMASMLPSASAMSAVNMVKSFGNCPDLEAIGAVGDAFCNPHIISDLNTIDIDPADIIERVEGSLVDEELEVPKIARGSRLAKHIVYCSERESPFGVVDHNIAQTISNFATLQTDVQHVNTAANATMNAIPIVGDVFEIIRNKDSIDYLGYISGETCVAGNDAGGGAFSRSPSWDESRYYQRFIEDQRLAESMGLVEKSAVTAFLEEYYAENPKDDSFEGVLARKTGQTRETIVATLDLLEYFDFIASYDPSDRYPLLDSAREVGIAERVYSVIIGDHTTSPKPYYIVYTDVRNRNFAV